MQFTFPEEKKTTWSHEAHSSGSAFQKNSWRSGYEETISQQSARCDKCTKRRIMHENPRIVDARTSQVGQIPANDLIGAVFTPDCVPFRGVFELWEKFSKGSALHPAQISYMVSKVKRNINSLVFALSSKAAVLHGVGLGSTWSSKLRKSLQKGRFLRKSGCGKNFAGSFVLLGNKIFIHIKTTLLQQVRKQEITD